MRFLKINRFDYLKKETLGEGFVYDDCNVIYKFFTLELPWENNQRNISCIPKGVYNIKKIESPHLGYCLDVKCVPNRTYIRIHSGNYYSQIMGCILVGDSLEDINHDGILDVTNSRATLTQIMALLPEETYLVITGEY